MAYDDYRETGIGTFSNVNQLNEAEITTTISDTVIQAAEISELKREIEELKHELDLLRLEKKVDVVSEHTTEPKSIPVVSTSSNRAEETVQQHEAYAMSLDAFLDSIIDTSITLPQKVEDYLKKPNFSCSKEQIQSYLLELSQSDDIKDVEVTTLWEVQNELLDQCRINVLSLYYSQLQRVLRKESLNNLFVRSPFGKQVTKDLTGLIADVQYYLAWI